MKLKNALLLTLYSIFIVFLFFVTAFNVKTFFDGKKVLSAESSVIQDRSTEEFWQRFLASNPNYIPGWIEIGRIDKVLEIDPNYFR